MRILRSALNHGCAPENIAHAIAGAWKRTRIGEDLDQWLYVGVDEAARPLEIISVTGDDRLEVVIHAMKLRSSYYPKGVRG